MTAPTTRTLDVPGAVLTYDIRNGDSGAGPVLLLIGSPVIFPSNHGGFLGGEYGQSGDPDAFAAKLREVLAEA